MEQSVETKAKTIIIKPVNKSKFSGHSSFSGTRTSFEGAQLGNSGYKTGLTKQEQELYENALSKPKGFLSADNAEFWGTMLNLSIPNDKPLYFTVNSTMDELKLKVILEHTGIANNELELAKNPKAEFYIEDAESKAKIEEVLIDFQMGAQEEFSNLTTDEKKGYLKLYGKKGVDTLSDRIIKTELFKEVTKDPKKFLLFVKNPDIKLRIDIEDMIEAGTLTKRGHYYNFQEEVIGNSIEAVVAFFKDLKNQSLLLGVKQATKNKKKGE